MNAWIAFALCAVGSFFLVDALLTARALKNGQRAPNDPLGRFYTRQWAKWRKAMAAPRRET